MHGEYCIRSEGDWICGGGCTHDADQELERLQKIETAARKHYKAIRGTMAAQGPSGLALKEALGEK